jgi:glycosyltransferase involved in cell wall biosynthesis
MQQASRIVSVRAAIRSIVTDQPSSYTQVRATLAYYSKTSLVGPSSRYRIYQFLPFLDAAGVSCRVYPLFGPAYFRILEIRFVPLRFVAKLGYVATRFLKRVWDLLTMPAADVVTIEGQIFPYVPAVVDRLIVRAFSKVVVEFDDAIYLTPFHRTKISILLRSVSASVVGNEGLARYARQYSSRVTVIPTVVDTQRFAPSKAESETGKALTVVWVGLAYNLECLNMVAPVLRELAEQGIISFRVVCSHRPMLDGLDIEFRPWSLEGEVEDLRDCQIGIMPLPDTEWARGKCGLKLLQYMACGMATVASPVGVNVEIVRDGETGFLASSPDAWREKLIRLCLDRELRVRFGLAGRRRVEEAYSLDLWGPRLAEHYLELANSSIVPGFTGEAAPRQVHGK